MHQELTISIASIAVMKDDRSDGISESFPSENPSVSVREEWTGALIARARAGESEAFESLMRQYERRVLTIASRLLSSRDEARDVEQEVFLRLHRYLHRFEDGRAFAPWLYRLTVNVCHDLNRRRKWSQTISLESEQERGRLDHLTDLRTPEEILVAKQQQRMVAAGLATLPEKERAAVVLRDVLGLETREVAEILQSSEATVRSQISMARIKLKKYRDSILQSKQKT
jgi:RNA polymerase sigma-70 factor (ECF subfamily)